VFLCIHNHIAGGTSNRFFLGKYGWTVNERGLKMFLKVLPSKLIFAPDELR